MRHGNFDELRSERRAVRRDLLVSAYYTYAEVDTSPATFFSQCPPLPGFTVPRPVRSISPTGVATAAATWSARKWRKRRTRSPHRNGAGSWAHSPTRPKKSLVVLALTGDSRTEEQPSAWAVAGPGRSQGQGAPGQRGGRLRQPSAPCGLGTEGRALQAETISRAEAGGRPTSA